MNLFVTHVQMPDNEPFAFGLFKVKGLNRTIFRFQYLNGKTVKVENVGEVFLLDSETSKTGKIINLKLTDDKVKQYEKDIMFLIQEGMTGAIY